jgi:outer membrane lipoprotein-sorting protein
MKRIFPVLLLLHLVVTAAFGAPGPAAADPVLLQLQHLAATVGSLESDFVQEKHLAMFREVLTSKGRFLFGKPDRLRWEITEPVATGFIIQGNEGRRWHQRTGRTESFDLAREPVMKLVAEQLMAWAAADFEKLGGQYRITVLSPAPVLLKLEPLAGAEKFLDHLQVTFAADGSHVQAVEVHEKDGDFTRLRFFNTRVNGPLPKDAF